MGFKLQVAKVWENFRSKSGTAHRPPHSSPQPRIRGCCRLDDRQQFAIPASVANPKTFCLKMSEMTDARCHSTENYAILRETHLQIQSHPKARAVYQSCKSLASCNVTAKR